jgi:hypothetical protein
MGQKNDTSQVAATVRLLRKRLGQSRTLPGLAASLAVAMLCYYAISQLGLTLSDLSLILQILLW